MVTTTSAMLWVVGMVMVAVTVEGQLHRRSGDDEDIPECAFENSVYTEKEGDERSTQDCPAQAVCADVWNTVRDWYNGTRCRDHRVMLNCRCPEGTMCPINDPNHVLYSNDKQSQVLCEPICDLEACRTRYRPAKEMVSSMDNPGLRYYRMNCRCADHHVPLRGRRGFLTRATMYSRLSYDFNKRLVFTQYRCKRLIEAGNDVCPPRPDRLNRRN